MKNPSREYVKVVSSLQPERIHSYLDRRGWIRERLPRPEIVLYRMMVGESDVVDLEIIVPAKKELVDYQKMTLRVLEVMAELEAKSIADVIEQVQFTSDLIKASISSRDTRFGTIALDKLETLIASSKNLIVFAAASEYSRAKFFKKALSRACELADRCRFGQTEVGSFVSSLYIPLPDEPVQKDLMIDKRAPIERKISERIAEGLEIIKRAIEADDHKIIVDSYEHGFNANMCDALSSMLETYDDAESRIRIFFDPMYQSSKQSQRSDFNVNVDHSALPLLDEASRELWAELPERELTLHGWIYELRSEQPSPGIEHRIRFRAQVDDQIYVVQTYLDDESYRLACDAHKAGKSIRISGLLKKEGRYWRLGNPHDFGILDNND